MLYDGKATTIKVMFFQLLSCALFFSPSFAINCYNGDLDMFYGRETKLRNANQTCKSSKICLVYIIQNMIYQRCYDDPNKPPLGCFISYDDLVMCYCNTDRCNIYDKVFGTEVTYLDNIECVNFFLTEDVSNNCVANLCTYVYPDINREKSIRTCPSANSFASFAIPPPTDNLFNSQEPYFFYSDACYNITQYPSYSTIYCRCSQTKCNNDQPFDISIGKVLCAMAGYTQTNYMYIGDEQFVFNETCYGHFCYVRNTTIERPKSSTDFELVPMVEYEKGCINAGEFGEYRIQVGNYHSNNYEWFVCQKDLCNSNIASAKSSLLVTLNNGPNVETSTKSSSGSVYKIIFIITILFNKFP